MISKKILLGRLESSKEFKAETKTGSEDEKDIVVTPGSGYGEYGEGYIRLSLTIPDEQLDKGINKLIN